MVYSAAAPMDQNVPQYMRHFIPQFAWDPKQYNKSNPIPFNMLKLSWNVTLQTYKNSCCVNGRSFFVTYSLAINDPTVTGWFSSFN